MQQDRPYRSFWILTACWFVILIFFRLFPSIDIGFSRLFYSTSACPPGGVAGQCGMFALGEIPFFVFIRTVLYYLPVVAAIALVASLLVPALDRRLDWPEISRRNRLVALGAWLLDAGLIVNVLLKAYSGRPRPADTSIFSGSLPFVPAGSFSGACTSNCSFISGEAASAGWLFCLLALLPAHARRWVIWPVVTLSVLTALLRVFFGRHFLSDAILAWLSAIIVFELLAAIFGWSERATKDESSPA
ncbi:phosphatase PAP2 family protein [Rhizobium sp. C4]|uniref:phosphatase PAP2 family protein n=1 Tax=Rhizobium sp. C4 TaxID=1349800 RepID=UPI001E3C7852|nr:phosphatase PAP2 family protein [Rhizobium sp. C4]MCD2171852.1 phosphatase PAP2 family protein [Rhizobium sp. C4]